MINGFEKITKDVTDLEKNKLAPIIIKKLNKCIGKSKSITNAKLIDLLITKGHSTNQARVRMIIHYIRINGLVERLVAGKKGYFISNDEQELNKYIDSLLQRVSSIEAIANQLHYQKDMKFTEQTKMFRNE